MHMRVRQRDTAVERMLLLKACALTDRAQRAVGSACIVLKVTVDTVCVCSDLLSSIASEVEGAA